MPNHIINVVKIESDDNAKQARIMLWLLNYQGVFDFNRIIPMPKILRNTRSPNDNNAEQCIKLTGCSDWYSWSNTYWGTKWNAYHQDVYHNEVIFQPWHLSCKPKNFLSGAVFRGYVKRINKKRFKAAVEYSGVPKVIRFQSAWSMPEPIYRAMSKRFPDVVFYVQYADEDIGSNCGEIRLKNGIVIESNIAPWNSHLTEAYKQWEHFASQVWGGESDE